MEFHTKLIWGWTVIVKADKKRFKAKIFKQYKIKWHMRGSRAILNLLTTNNWLVLKLTSSKTEEMVSQVVEIKEVWQKSDQTTFKTDRIILPQTLTAIITKIPVKPLLISPHQNKIMNSIRSINLLLSISRISFQMSINFKTN